LIGLERKAKLEKSRFKQQNLPAWRPNPTLLTTLITFVIFGIIFLSLGIFLVEWARTITEIEIEYNERCKRDKVCPIPLIIEEDIETDIFVYYQLDNLYQNHRRFVNSRDDFQLRGDVKEVSDLTSCEPVTQVKDIGIPGLTNLDGEILDPEAPANPCGLIARSYFNDLFTIIDTETSEEVEISPKGIAWDTDVSGLFQRPENYKKIQWVDVTDERFIVWMRVAGMKDFRKPWGIIRGGIKAGEYTLIIENNYDVNSFNGGKKFFMSTTNAYGGTNKFLAVSYLVVGSL